MAIAVLITPAEYSFAATYAIITIAADLLQLIAAAMADDADYAD